MILILVSVAYYFHLLDFAKDVVLNRNFSLWSWVLLKKTVYQTTTFIFLFPALFVGFYILHLIVFRGNKYDRTEYGSIKIAFVSIVVLILISVTYYFYLLDFAKGVVLNKNLSFWSWILFEKSVYLITTFILFFNAFFIGFYILYLIVFRGNKYDRTKYGLVEIVFVSVVVGLGVIGQGTMFLGFAKLYNFWVFMTLHCAIFLAGLFWLKRNAKVHLPERQFLHYKESESLNPTVSKYILISVICLFIITLVARLNYINGSDAQTSHINAVLYWIEKGRYLPFIHERTGDPFTMNSVQPLMGRMLYLNGIILINSFIAALMQAVFFGMVILGVFLLGSRMFGRKIAWLSIFLLLGNAKFFYYHLFEVDDYLINIVFAIAAILVFLFFRATRNKSWLIIFGMATGFVLCVKYYGIAEAIYLLGLMAIYLKSSYKQELLPKKTIALALLLIFLIPSPWFIKNIVVYGNPVWPQFSNFFGAQLGYALELPAYIHRYEGFQYLHTLSPDDQSLIPAYIRFFALNLVANTSNGYYFSALYLPLMFIGLFWYRTRYFLAGFGFYCFFVIICSNSMAFGHKWMIIPYSFLTPIIAGIIVSVFKKGISRNFVYILVVVLVFHTMHKYRYGIRDFIPVKTWHNIFNFDPNADHELNKLGRSAKLYSGFVPSVTYNRTGIHIPLVTEWGILAEDWEETYCYWKRRGITHYYIEPPGSSYSRNRWGTWITFFEKWKPEKVEKVRTYSENFKKNLKRRNEVLSQYGNVNREGVIKLPEGLPAFCEGKGEKPKGFFGRD